MSKKNNKGFTLIELIVVIAILAILIGMVAPNVPNIINRNKIKADILTAQQIGRAVRGWYASELFNERGSMEEVPAGKIYVEDFEKTFPKDDKVIPVKYSDIYKIEESITLDYVPTSFKPDGEDANNPYYGVYLTTTGHVARIVVTIQDEDNSELTFDEDFAYDEVNYDGEKAGIAYVE